MPDMLAMPTNSIKKGVVEASYREAYRTKLSPEFTGIAVQHLLLCLALYLQLGDENSTAEIVKDVDIFNQLYVLVGRNKSHYPTKTNNAKLIGLCFNNEEFQKQSKENSSLSKMKPYQQSENKPEMR
nr:9539_t:CDS:2 [Entrophospora candida]